MLWSPHPHPHPHSHPHPPCDSPNTLGRFAIGASKLPARSKLEVLLTDVIGTRRVLVFQTTATHDSMVSSPPSPFMLLAEHLTAPARGARKACPTGENSAFSAPAEWGCEGPRLRPCMILRIPLSFLVSLSPPRLLLDRTPYHDGRYSGRGADRELVTAVVRAFEPLREPFAGLAGLQMEEVIDD